MLKTPEKKKEEKKNLSFEPESNQRPKDIIAHSTVLRSTNWAIEGSRWEVNFFNIKTGEP